MRRKREFWLTLRLMFDTNAVHWSLYTLVFPRVESFICCFPLLSFICSFLLFSLSILAFISSTSFVSTKFGSWALSFPYAFFGFWAASFCRFAGDCSWIKSEPGLLFSRAFFLEEFSLSSVDFDSCCNLNNWSSSRRGVT